MTKPYKHEIRVGWGDCDPAKIAYTGRIPSWCLDAINGWWEAHLNGDGWYQMELDRGFGTPFVHMDIDFSHPVTPRHRLICEVEPSKIGTSSLGFRVRGYQDGQLCFRGNFICAFIVSGSMTKRDVPPEIRAMIEPLLSTA